MKLTGEVRIRGVCVCQRETGQPGQAGISYKTPSSILSSHEKLVLGKNKKETRIYTHVPLNGWSSG